MAAMVRAAAGTVLNECDTDRMTGEAPTRLWLPPLALAMLFQRFITNLNIVDPVTSNTD